MIAAIEEQASESRKQTRRAWWFASALTGGVLAICGFLFFQDVDPPDDADMMPMFTEGGGPNNPLRKFIAEIKQLPEIDWFKLSDEAKDKKIGSEDELQGLIKAHETDLKIFHELTSTDIGEWRWRLEDDGGIDASLKLEYLRRIQSLVNLINAKAILIAREGKSVESADLAIRLLNLGCGMERGEGTAIHWLVAVTAQAVALGTLEYILSLAGNDNNTLEQVNRALVVSSKERLRALKQVFKVEYRYVKNVLKERDDLIDLLNVMGLEKWYKGQFFQPNRTLHFYIAYQRPILHALDKSSVDYFAAKNDQMEKLQLLENNWRKHLSPNASGIRVVLFVLPALSRSSERCLQIEVRMKTLKIMCALRLYELEHGELPQRLDELVPQYLDQVPVDPFDGKPLRYDPSSQILYSVSENLRDDGGRFKEPKSHREPDYGFYYPWSDKASEAFDKRFGAMP